LFADFSYYLTVLFTCTIAKNLKNHNHKHFQK